MAMIVSHWRAAWAMRGWIPARKKMAITLASLAGATRHLFQDLACFFQQGCAGLGQLDVLAVADQQLHLQPLFQRLDGAAQKWWSL